ncbi:uncharacterized protein [Setaria viridis]|uniref:uncharacterized protein n=1 Tax=Setaria viridis TaxID=4556 RepID=UPI003B3B5C42
MEPFLAAQMQLLQNLTTAVQNLQAQQNQQPPQAPQAPRDKHREFMSHHPPTYSHSVDPLDADDWLKVINKKLDITQCNDREKVLYAAGRLEGAAADWWDAYTTAHANANAITWEEFRNSFRTHHIPAGVMKLKQKEFLALKQGNMTISEYRDKFTQLSRYAPNEVDTDEKRQERFLDGLIGPLNYQLQSHTFPNFQTLLDKAIGLESKRKELGEQKRKFQSQGQSSSNTRPRFNSPQGSQFRSGGQGGSYQQNQQFQRTAQPPQRFNQQAQRNSNSQHNRANHATGTPARTNQVTPVRPNGCFKCGEVGHYANACPKNNTQIPQKTNGQKSQQQSQARNGNQNSQGNKGQQNFMRGRVNHVTAETAQEAPDVVFGMFLVNSEPASVLFDSGATHSFITDQFVVKHNIPKHSMKKTLLVSSPGGDMETRQICPRVNLKIMGIDFLANLVVLKSNGVDVILGMDWLKGCDGIILCAKRSVLLTSPQGDRIEFTATAPSEEKCLVNQIKGKSLEDIKVASEYPDVFPEDLPGEGFSNQLVDSITVHSDTTFTKLRG